MVQTEPPILAAEPFLQGTIELAGGRSVASARATTAASMTP
jgi:hypothetical protein